MKHFSIKLRKILLCNSFYYFLLFCTFLYITIYIKNYIPQKIYNENDTKFNLKIKEYKFDGDKLSIEFKENLIGTYYIKSKEELNELKEKLNINDSYEVTGTLSIPSNNTIPNTFNYKNYLYHKNIEFIMQIDNLKLIEKNKNILIKIKNYIYKRIQNINNEYLYAFILGKSSYIDSEAYNNYKINGVTHLFALSGLHVSLFSSIILLILKKLKLSETLSFIITSIFLIFFSFIASFTPSILRATIYFILANINNIKYLYIKPINILYITLIILLLINPNYIYNTGFILSFTITFYILLFNEKYKIKNKILSLLIISIISFSSSLPIIINMNYEINIIGFLNNLIFIPLVSYVIFPLSIITVFISKLSILLIYLTNIMELISSISSNIINVTFIFSKLKLYEILIYELILILSIKKSKKFFILLILLILFFYIKPIFNKNNYIYYTDVSQGDSTLIKINNKAILIDTGGKLSEQKEEWQVRNKNYNTMINSLIPFYKSIGIKKINTLILTHGDSDHMGYAINLVENFKVENVVFNCGNYNNLEKKLINILKEKNIKYYTCINELNVDNYKLQFLNTGVYDNENDNSSVIYLKYNNYKFLFMGDASITREKDILEKYNLKNIDFLKIGHHGSNTSSSEEFIKNINPKYSLISVGINNRYGHPKQSVLDILEKNNSKVYRTDIDGSIGIKINKNKYSIETFSP